MTAVTELGDSREQPYPWDKCALALSYYNLFENFNAWELGRDSVFHSRCCRKGDGRLCLVPVEHRHHAFCLQPWIDANGLRFVTANRPKVGRPPYLVPEDNPFSLYDPNFSL